MSFEGLATYDANEETVFVGDTLNKANSNDETIYQVDAIYEDGDIQVSFSNKPEMFGAQLGYISGTEKVSPRDFVLSEESKASRRTIMLTYTVSVAQEISVPYGMSSDEIKKLAFVMATDAVADLESQPLEVGVDDPARNIPPEPGWSVPAEFANGWMSLEDAIR